MTHLEFFILDAWTNRTDSTLLEQGTEDRYALSIVLEPQFSRAAPYVLEMRSQGSAKHFVPLPYVLDASSLFIDDVIGGIESQVVPNPVQNQSPFVYYKLTFGKVGLETLRTLARSQGVKTVFLCKYLGSEALRREINEGLNVVENWNSANSFVFYGKSGEIATNRLEDQELAVLSPHLLQVSMVYVNTLMIQRVLVEPNWLVRMGKSDLRALSPLIYAPVNPYGTFKARHG